MNKIVIAGVLFILTFSLLLAQGGDTCAGFYGNDYFDLGNNYKYAGDLTIEMWVYHDDWSVPAEQTMISCTNAGGYSISIVDNGENDKIRFVYRSGGSYLNITYPVSGLSSGWHHIAATHSTTDADLYVDGINADGVGSTITFDGNNHLLIGAEASGGSIPEGRFYNGYIDEVRIWNRALSQTEINLWKHKQITDTQRPVYHSNLQGYYKLDSSWGGGWLDDAANNVTTNSEIDLDLHGCTLAPSYAPIGDYPANYVTNTEALWRMNHLNWSNESTGLSIQDSGLPLLTNSEMIGLSNNGLTGTTTGDLPSGVQFRAATIWYIDDFADDQINLCFNLSDFGAESLIISDTQTKHLKLLYRSGSSGSFNINHTASIINGNEITFENYLPVDGYYTIGRHESYTENTIKPNFDSANSISSVDLDSDGDMDILGTASGSYYLYWWENDGTGSFTENNIGTYDYSRDVQAVDFDSDGDMDILTSSFGYQYGSDISWWRNNGSESFTKYTIADTDDGAKSIFAIDIDGDNDIDFVRASASGDDVSWFKNNGNQSFSKHLIRNYFYEPTSVYATDLDKDGDIDILGTSADNDDVIWWENDGTESFAEHILDGSFDYANSIYSVDINSDGLMDVLCAARSANDIAWWKNEADGNFTKYIIDNNFDNACEAYAADVDGDGDMDIVGAAYDADEIAWWQNDGNENFTKCSLTTNFDGAFSVFASDLDNDGDIDISGSAIIGDKLSWWQQYDSPSATVTLSDGSGFVPSIESGQSEQVIGRFQLISTEVFGLTDINIKLEGNRTGISDFRLWQSNDATFSSTIDIQLGSMIELDPGEGNTIIFDEGFVSPISTGGTYYFLTCDIDPNATGVIQPVLENNSSLTFSGGSLNGSINNAPLFNHDLPIVVTEDVTNIKYNSAQSGGEVTDKGGNISVDYGICWSTSQNPTISDALSDAESGYDVFISFVTGLKEETTYYVRAYATNSIGTGYGTQIEFVTSLEEQHFLSFEGTDDFIETEVDDLSGSEITIEYWFKGSSTQSAVRQQVGGSNYIVSGWNDLHILSSDGGTGAGIMVGNDAEDGNWHHIAMTWQQDTINGFISYLDGELVDQRNSSNTEIPNINANVFFGSSNGSTQFMSGFLDDIRIWNIARTNEQIRENMYIPLIGDEAGLICYWKFNEGSGNITCDDANGNVGTLANMTMEDWQSTTIPFGEGIPDSQTEAPGTVEFINTGLSMYFNSQSGAEITVSKINDSPNVNPIESTEVFDSCFWVVNRYGSGSFNADLTFSVSEDISIFDEIDLNRIQLFTRTSNSDDSWTFLTSASSVNADTETATFSNITEFSQFVICRDAPVENFPGSALEFDGINDYVDLDEPDNLKLENFTITTWFKRTGNGSYVSTGAGGLSAEPLVTKGRGQSDNSNVDMNYFLGIGETTKVICADLENMTNGGNHPVYGTTPIQDNTWYHTAATYDGNEWRLYLNGNLEAESIENVTPRYDSIQDNAIGSALNSNGTPAGYFKGLIDEVSIWDTALDSIHIRENMHLCLADGETGLVSYWQFNEGTGTATADITSGNNGILQNMGEADWLNSSIPIGGGVSNTQTESVGIVDFINTNLSINFETIGSAEITVTRIDTSANINPSGIDVVFDEQYWVINRFGSGSFDAELTFSVNEDLIDIDEYYSANIKLYTRSSNADTNWVLLSEANTVNADTGEITFSGITSFSQFIIGKSLPEISVDKTSIDFGGVLLTESKSDTLWLYNSGNGTLKIDDIQSNIPQFTIDVTNCSIAPSDSCQIIISFSPTENDEYSATLTISSNDPDEQITEINISGEGLSPEITLLESIDFEQVTQNFNSLDYGSDSYPHPAFTDLDGNGLLDLIIGEWDGNLNHYEQTSNGSSSFTLITNSFNSIDVGYASSPTFTDLDADNLLDLIIGEASGNLNHYEQDGVNSTDFTLITQSFSSINVNSGSNPTFTDLDGDNLLDLIIGAYNKKLYHYEQNSPNSTSFTQISNNFLGVEINNPEPTFTDFDGDGLLDLIVGEYYGKLKYYKQDSINSTTFNLINNLNSIDIGFYSSPAFTDLNSDNILDLIIGEGSGNLNHYEQNGLSAIDFGNVLVNNSEQREYYLKTEELGYNLQISCPDGFEVSQASQREFAQNLTITPESGRISETIYVQFSPLTVNEYNGEVSHTSNGVETVSIAISGAGMGIDNYPGTALEFDGENDYVETALNDLSGSEITIEYWFKGSSTHSAVRQQSGSYVVAGWNDLHILSNDGGTGNGLPVGAGAEDGNWHHIAMSWKQNTTMGFVSYLDGAIVGQRDSGNDPIPNINAKVMFASNNGTSQFMTGCLEEIRIWDVARDSLQIRENMYLPLDSSEDGLVGCWQFNEGAGTSANGNSTLYNMDEDDWIDSTIPFGDGMVDSQIEAAGNLDFIDSGLSMYFNSVGNARITVTRIDTLANINPSGCEEVFDYQYWVVNRYGSGDFNVNLSFIINEELMDNDETEPGNIFLFARESNSDSDWQFLAAANQIDASNKVITFNGISSFSQFSIGRVGAEIDFSTYSIDFGKAQLGTTKSDSLWIFNTGNDTLFVSNIASNLPEFTVDPIICVISPSDSCMITITYTPTVEEVSEGTITISSNDLDEAEAEIDLLGEGVSATVALLRSTDFEFVTANFNGIDIGDYSSPIVIDPDDDNLLDLVIGEHNGNLNHYEQDSLNSSNFTLVTSGINSIDVGSYCYPAFTDLDGDNLFDLIIGEADGNLNHYEQDSLNSYTFSYITNSFNSIDIGSSSKPTFIDIDGDNLLDLIIGKSTGTLSHYEQSSQFSDTFTHITNSFNAIAVGEYTTPTFYHYLDDDNLIDLIIGERNGRLHYYEQISENSYSFELKTSYFNSIDVGSFSDPTFTDFNSDNILDLLVGETNGNLNHYQQEEILEHSFGRLIVGNLAQHSYILKATDVAEELLIACPDGFSVSLSNDSGFSQNLLITPENDIINKSIYIRFSPSSTNEYNGNITHSIFGLNFGNISINGTGVESTDNFPGFTLQIDGVDDYVETSLDDLSGSELTIEYWFKGSSTHSAVRQQSGSYVVAGWNDLHILSNDGGTGNGLPVGAGAEDGNWHHIAMTWEQNTTNGFVSYLDGVIVGQRDSGNDPIPNINAKVMFASNNGTSQFMTGCLEEIRIWNVVRDSLQIRENMYLSLTGSESGLVGYWQCNEGSGSILSDVVGGYSGALLEIDTLNCWINSVIPFGDGFSNSQPEVSGLINFIDTNLSMNFETIGSAEITVTRIDTTSNTNPIEPDEVFSQPYWIVNRYGNGDFNADVTFTTSEDLTSNDENNPSQIALFTRASNSDDVWIYLTSASSVDAAIDEATFENIIDFSQFIITRWIWEIDSPQNVAIQVVGSDVQINWDEVAGASSYKVFAADSPGGSFEDVTEQGSFSVSRFSIRKDFRHKASMVKRNSQKKLVNESNNSTLSFPRRIRSTQTWTSPVDGSKKFYYVVASTETVRMSISEIDLKKK